MPELDMSVTVDSLMAEFIQDFDMIGDYADSIFCTLDNYIDDLIIKTMDSEDSIFETDRGDSNTPFNYIIDKVLEKVDNIETIGDDEYAKAIENSNLGKSNSSDPDYCEGIDFIEITPEDFQLYIPKLNREEIQDDKTVHYTHSSLYDSIYNA